jgi:hypothetical protein
MLGTLGEKENASFWLNYMPSTILGWQIKGRHNGHGRCFHGAYRPKRNKALNKQNHVMIKTWVQRVLSAVKKCKENSRNLNTEKEPFFWRLIN